MIYLISILAIIILSNQYFIFNEEFFIILAFLSLCYLVYTNLGNVVESELHTRMEKIKSSYVDLVKKKKLYSNLTQNTNNIKQKYLININSLYNEYLELLKSTILENKFQEFLELEKNYEIQLIVYFAKVVAEKIKVC